MENKNIDEDEEKKEYTITDIDDYQRIDFLFADFPSDRNINPKHWESKVLYWKTEIEKSCRFYGDFCINCEKLKARFHDRDGRSPKGLLTVIGDLYQSNEIHMRSSYIDLMDDTWGQWSYNLAKKSSLWLWRKATGYNDQTMFVVRELLEESSRLLLEKHYKSVKYENTDNIVPWNVIRNLYKINNGNPLSEENLVCLIGYLKYQGKCKVGVMDTGERVVKFACKEIKNVDSVCEIDFEIIKLKKAIAKLHLECTNIEKEIKKLQETAQELVKKKLKEKAKKILAQRNRINKSLHVKQNALMTMREQLRLVQDSESTKMIADAFSSSVAALRHSYKEQGLTVEKIEDVIDETLETKDMINEVEEALSGFGRLDNDVDIDELEKELEELTANDISFSELPEPPTLSPQKVSTPKPKLKPKIAELLPS